MENKPLETDSQEETLDEELEEILDDNQESQEEGNNDVDNAVDQDEIFLNKMKEISGRDFKNIEDAKKHYKNLASFVGKKEEPKEEPKVETNDESLSAVKEISSKLERMEFISENPDAKEYFESHIKPFADGKGLSLDEAWKEMKPLVDSKKAEEQEIGVNSKNVITPKSDPKLKSLEDQARRGNPEAQEEYVKKMLGEK